ncbi:MAG: energy-coupled thiamine transporter ThiT [Eubacteriales bacterium]
MISINKRKISSCIILSLITLGIYQIYWEYLLVKNTRAIKKDESSCTGEMLCLIFVPFYSFYWWFTRGKIVKDSCAEYGCSATGNEIAYLILNLFGLSIVSMAIMQNDFNSLPSESTNSVQRSAEKTRAMTEGAVMIAAATVLSLIRFTKLPFGGSVTLLSMFPIILYSIRRGVEKGLFVSFGYAVLQLLLDIGEIMTWGLTPGVLVACFLLDYLIPFTLIGLGGLFRKHGYAGWLGGTAFVIVLRFASHYISGVYLWQSVGEILGRNIESTYLYSLIYNSLYMVPELIFTMIAAAVFFAVPQTKKVLLQMGLTEKLI